MIIKKGAYTSMNIEALSKLLNYINDNNGWGDKIYENRHVKHRHCFKYVDVSFDTRDGCVWKITLRNGTDVEKKTFRVESEEDLNKVYAYLDTPLKINLRNGESQNETSKVQITQQD